MNIQFNELTDIVSLRNPSRKNQFSILANARLGDKKVLLQQSKVISGSTRDWDIDEWFQAMPDDMKTSYESNFLHVWGVLSQPLLSPIAPISRDGSFASSYRLDRPVFVVNYCERGSLRDCLDRGEFLSSSDWTEKLTVLQNVATALHGIKCKLHGRQHGAVSSDSVHIDKDGTALLSWHRVKGSRQDFMTGSCQDWRWFTPKSILQLQRILSNGSADHSLISGLTYDDMYSFGVLAWELATEELPFEPVNTPCDLSPSEISIEARFRKSPPAEIRALIQQCTKSNLNKRPSWCDVLQQIKNLFHQTIGSVSDLEESYTDEHVETSQDTSSSEDGTQLQIPEDNALTSDKSNVVALMESTLTSTFYKKELPAHLVSITSAEGRKLFREMILAGTGECFFSLFTAFNTQSDPAFCGVSSLSMVLNALEIDPRRQWQGVWRWYSEEQLDCCASIEVMKQKGITFNQFRCLANCHAEVVAKPADCHTLEEFRRDVQMIASSEGSHMVLSFSRAALGQTGSGHFSPIGGYHADEDKVLVLDCARFKYPPFYATIQELWDSFLGVDPETGKCRGYFLITATSKQKEEIRVRRQHAQAQALDSSTISPISSSISTAQSSLN